MKKPRTKKYRPRPHNPDGGLIAIAKVYDRGERAAPLLDSQLTDLGVAYWLSFEQLRAGDATEEAWSCVVCALNIGMVLAEGGLGANYMAEIVRALDGAFRAKIRSARSGNFRLDGEALRDITNALSVHDQQMAVATKNEVTTAMRTVHERITAGEVYREAA